MWIFISSAGARADGFLESPVGVLRLVATHFDQFGSWPRFMMSGTRKAPPISTSSPRETTDFLALGEGVERRRKTAAALLFTTVAASAPVSSCTDSFIEQRRDEVVAVAATAGLSTSYSRAQGERAASTISGDGFVGAVRPAPGWCAGRCRSG